MGRLHLFLCFVDNLPDHYANLPSRGTYERLSRDNEKGGSVFRIACEGVFSVRQRWFDKKQMLIESSLVIGLRAILIEEK